MPQLKLKGMESGLAEMLGDAAPSDDTQQEVSLEQILAESGTEASDVDDDVK